MVLQLSLSKFFHLGATQYALVYQYCYCLLTSLLLLIHQSWCFFFIDKYFWGIQRPGTKNKNVLSLFKKYLTQQQFRIPNWPYQEPGIPSRCGRDCEISDKIILLIEMTLGAEQETQQKSGICTISYMKRYDTFMMYS